nr:hypothetical protein [Tanacetum cinerariifolium]
MESSFVFPRTSVYYVVQWIRRIGRIPYGVSGGQYLFRNFILRSSQVVTEPEGLFLSQRLMALVKGQEVHLTATCTDCVLSNFVLQVVFCLGLRFALEALLFVLEDLAFCLRRSCVLSQKHCILSTSKILRFVSDTLRFVFKDLAFFLDSTAFCEKQLVAFCADCMVLGIVHRCLQQDDIHNGYHVQAVAATDDFPTIPKHTTVETPMNMSPENKAHFQAEKEAIHLLLTGIGDEIYSTVDACQTAQEM